jgi:hypothetical protein
MSERLTVTFSQGNFTSEETKEVIESLSAICPVEQCGLFRGEMGELPAVLILSIGFVGGAIATAFFSAMGSDLYQTAKEKIMATLGEKKNPTLKFEMAYGDTKISVVTETADSEKLNRVFDTIDKARDLAVNELNKKETPELTEMTIRCNTDWTLESGQNWKPPTIIMLYKYNGETGQWELTQDWSQVLSSLRKE